MGKGKGAFLVLKDAANIIHRFSGKGVYVYSFSVLLSLQSHMIRQGIVSVLKDFCIKLRGKHYLYVESSIM